MALACVRLLCLLIACCSVATIARNLDFTQEMSLPAERYWGFSEDADVSSVAGSGHDRENPSPSVLDHEDATVHASEIFAKSVLHDDDEEMRIHESQLRLQEEHIFLPSVSHREQVSLPSLSHDEDDVIYHESGLDLRAEYSVTSIPSLLEQNGLPIGLLPSSVANYSITDEGEFTVFLQKACYVKFDYKVYYAQTIRGTLSYGTITHLSGIKAKEAFFWVSVTGIRTDVPSSRYIYFDVGPISKKLSISQFETIPVCTAKAMAFSSLA